MVVQQLDDRNPSIVYSGTWQGGGISPEFNNTTTWTNNTGSTATVTFSGASISVWGTISPLGTGSAPRSSYSIDNGAVSTFTGTQISSAQYNQLFFQSDQLSVSNHTLNIATLTDGAHFYLDYLLVVTPDSSLTTSSSSSSSSTSVAPTTSGSSSSSSGTEVPIGAIVGGIVGGIALLLISVFGILLLRNRMNERKYRRNQRPEVAYSLWSKRPSSSTGLTPFITQPYDPLHRNDYGSELQADFSSYLAPTHNLRDPYEGRRSPSFAQTSQPSRPSFSSDLRIPLRDHLPSSKAATLSHSRNVSSSSNSTRPPDHMNAPPPVYDG